MNIAQSWKYHDRRKPEVGTMPYSYRNTSRVPHRAQYNRQHCTPHAFGQFGARYMYRPDDKYLILLGFEPSISEYRATP